MNCPGCHVALLEKRVSPFVVSACRKCGGCAATIAALRSGIRYAFLQTAWNRAVGHGRTGRRKCPSCAKPMRVLPINGPDIDLCTGCQILWFDRGELDALPKLSEAEMHEEQEEEEQRQVRRLHQQHENLHRRISQLQSPEWF